MKGYHLVKNNFFKKIADTGFNISCQDFFFVTRDFYCLSKYINGVKICQSVCVSLKQEKFAKKQSKFSWIDFIWNLTQYFNQIGSMLWDSWFSKYSHSVGQFSIIWFRSQSQFRFWICYTYSHSVVLLRQADNYVIYYLSIYFVCLVHDCLGWLLNITHLTVDSGSYSYIN